MIKPKKTLADYFGGKIPPKKEREAMLNEAKMKHASIREKLEIACLKRNTSMASSYAQESFNLTQFIYILQCCNLSKKDGQAMVDAMNNGIEEGGREAMRDISLLLFVLLGIPFLLVLVIVSYFK